MEGRRSKAIAVSYRKDPPLNGPCLTIADSASLQWETSTNRAQKMSEEVSRGYEHLVSASSNLQTFHRSQEDRREDIEKLISSLRPVQREYIQNAEKRASTSSAA